MPTIDTLIEDVKAVLSAPENVITPEAADELGRSLARVIVSRLTETRTRNGLRMSALGVQCDRKSWYQANAADKALPLDADTRLKFLFGDIIEEVMLFLAKVAGHDVTHDQHEVSVQGVKGHLDAKIDGVVIDVKSASAAGMRKFRDHGLESDDPFGYLAQIGAYVHAEGDKEGGFWAVNKESAEQVIDIYENKVDIEGLVAHKKAVAAQPEPPERCYTDQAYGKNGNRKLGLSCTYCDFKAECWPGVRAFDTGRAKPVFLTVVEEEPDLPEVPLNA